MVSVTGFCLATKTLIAKRMPCMPRKPSVPKETCANFWREARRVHSAYSCAQLDALWPRYSFAPCEAAYAPWPADGETKRLHLPILCMQLVPSGGHGSEEGRAAQAWRSSGEEAALRAASGVA